MKTTALIAFFTACLVAVTTADPEPVTEDMLVGAVFAVFHTSGAPAGPVVASNGSTIPTALCKTF